MVEGINRVWKHVRPSQRNPQGGRIQKDAPIHISNVMPIDPTTGKGVRLRYEIRDGKKHRIAVGSGTDLGTVGKEVDEHMSEEKQDKKKQQKGQKPEGGHARAKPEGQAKGPRPEARAKGSPRRPRPGDAGG